MRLSSRNKRFRASSASVRCAFLILVRGLFGAMFDNIAFAVRRLCEQAYVKARVDIGLLTTSVLG